MKSHWYLLPCGFMFIILLWASTSSQAFQTNHHQAVALQVNPRSNLDQSNLSPKEKADVQRRFEKISKIPEKGYFERTVNKLSNLGSTLSIWSLNAIAAVTLLINGLSMVKNVFYPPTFRWDAVMTDPSFINRVENLMQKASKKPRFEDDPEWYERVLQFSIKYWHLMLAVCIMVSVVVLLLVKSRGRGGGDSDTPQFQVIKIGRKKLKALNKTKSSSKAKKKTQKN